MSAVQSRETTSHCVLWNTGKKSGKKQTGVKIQKKMARHLIKVERSTLKILCDSTTLHVELFIDNVLRALCAFAPTLRKTKVVVV